jgi:hypothetical protein
MNWSEKVVAGLKGVNPELEKLFFETLSEAKNKYSGQL